MYIFPVGAELCHTDGRADGRMDVKQTFAFRTILGTRLSMTRVATQPFIRVNLSQFSELK